MPDDDDLVDVPEGELVTWFRAQLDEDERVARAVSADRPGPWEIATDSIGQREIVSAPRRDEKGWDYSVFPDVWHEAAGAHVIAWDPARVLAEVAAKRRILDELEDAGWADEHLGLVIAVRALAQPYAGRDGWRAEWATRA